MNRIGEKNYTLEEIVTIKEMAQKSQDKLNSLVTIYDDLEQQWEATSNKQESPFYQIPIVLKDNVSTAGVRTTASSRILDNYVPIYDATIVKKLRDAGAVFIAKSSMDELGMGGTNLSAYTGPVSNPYDVTRISGGSSGGSAAIVASGIVPFAIGTDTGDSVRKPAAFCGIVGMKPTYGRISRYGIIPYASSLDHVGYFTRSVRDAALALEVLAGRDDADMTSSNAAVLNYASLLTGELKGKKIAVFKNVIDVISNKEIVAKFNELMNQLKEKGAIVEEVSFPQELAKSMFSVYNIISNCEATANHSNLDGIRFGMQEEGSSVEEVMTNSRTKGLSFSIRRRFITGGYGLMEENQKELFQKAQKVRRKLVDQLATILKEYDVFVAPSSGQIAPKIDDVATNNLTDEYLVAENHMVLGNFSGYPSINLPIGFYESMPIGICLTGRPFDEVTVFDISLGIEQITGLKDLKKEVL